MSDWKKEAFEGQENYDGSEDFGSIALEKLKEIKYPIKDR